MTAPDDDRARYGDIFRIREFSAVFVAHVASMLGDIVAQVALTVLVYQRTRSPALAAATMSLSFLPYLLGGTLLSSAAARWRTRRTLVICNVASAGIVAAMSLFRLPVVALLALVFVLGLIAPVFGGVRAATLAQILPPGRRVRARPLSVSLGCPGRPGVGLRHRRAAADRRVTARRVAHRCGLVRAVRTDPANCHPRAATRRANASCPSSMNRCAICARSCRIPRLRRVLLVEWLLPTCAVAPEALAAPYVAHLGLASRYVGFWLTAIPIGTVVADVVAARLLSLRRQRAVALPAMALTCLPLVAFLIRPSFAVAFTLLIALGLSSAWNVMVDQEVIAAAPDSLRARGLVDQRRRPDVLSGCRVRPVGVGWRSVVAGRRDRAGGRGSDDRCRGLASHCAAQHGRLIA